MRGAELVLLIGPHAAAHASAVAKHFDAKHIFRSDAPGFEHLADPHLEVLKPTVLALVHSGGVPKLGRVLGAKASTLVRADNVQFARVVKGARRGEIINSERKAL